MYAVEYTEMAKHARTLVEKNGFKDVIEVIQGSAESVQLPEKVRIAYSIVRYGMIFMFHVLFVWYYTLLVHLPSVPPAIYI